MVGDVTNFVMNNDGYDGVGATTSSVVDNDIYDMVNDVTSFVTDNDGYDMVQDTTSSVVTNDLYEMLDDVTGTVNINGRYDWVPDVPCSYGNITDTRRMENTYDLYDNDRVADVNNSAKDCDNIYDNIDNVRASARTLYEHRTECGTTVPSIGQRHSRSDYSPSCPMNTQPATAYALLARPETFSKFSQDIRYTDVTPMYSSNEVMRYTDGMPMHSSYDVTARSATRPEPMYTFSQPLQFSNVQPTLSGTGYKTPPRRSPVSYATIPSIVLTDDDILEPRMSSKEPQYTFSMDKPRRTEASKNSQSVFHSAARSPSSSASSSSSPNNKYTFVVDKSKQAPPTTSGFGVKPAVHTGPHPFGVSRNFTREDYTTEPIKYFGDNYMSSEDRGHAVDSSLGEQPRYARVVMVATSSPVDAPSRPRSHPTVAPWRQEYITASDCSEHYPRPRSAVLEYKTTSFEYTGGDF